MTTDDGRPFYEVCANCGADLGLSEWPPVVEASGNDGDGSLYSFCDEDCRAEWSPGD